MWKMVFFVHFPSTTTLGYIDWCVSFREFLSFLNYCESLTIKSRFKKKISQVYIEIKFIETVQNEPKIHFNCFFNSSHNDRRFSKIGS